MVKIEDSSLELRNKNYKMVLGNARQEYYHSKYSGVSFFKLEKSLKLLVKQYSEYKNQKQYFLASLCLPEIIYLQLLLGKKDKKTLEQ